MPPPEAARRELQPAPGRGQYDRRQPREARLLEQRERLLAATALALGRDAQATIGSVVKLAGVSRNTFYEYFDDLANARAAALGRAVHRLSALLKAAEARTRTPVERWRALAHAYLEWLLLAPAEALLCLASARVGLGTAGQELQAAFSRSLSTVRASGVRTQDRDGLLVTAVAAAGEVLGRQIIAERAGSAGDSVRGDRERDRYERAIVDVAVRLLR